MEYEHDVDEVLSVCGVGKDSLGISGWQTPDKKERERQKQRGRGRGAGNEARRGLHRHMTGRGETELWSCS